MFVPSVSDREQSGSGGSAREKSPLRVRNERFVPSINMPHVSQEACLILKEERLVCSCRGWYYHLFGIGTMLDTFQRTGKQPH